MTQSGLTRAAHAIGEAVDFAKRLSEPARLDELGRLAVTFDEMLTRLDQAFAAQQRLVADARRQRPEIHTPRFE